MPRRTVLSGAHVVALHVWPPDRAPEPRGMLELTFEGVTDDRHAGLTMPADARTSKVYDKGRQIRNHRQLSLVAVEELTLIAEALGIDEIAPGLIGDNVTLAGAPDLTTWAPMTRLEFTSGAVIITGGANAPCVIAGRMVAAAHDTRPSAFPKAALGRRGITGWVDAPGEVRVGDGVIVHPPG